MAATGEPELFSVVFDTGPDEIDVDLDGLGDHRTLAPGHVLVHTDLTQSQLYHRVKRRLPPDTPLFVGALGGTPKMKGQSAGSVAWVRSRSD